MHGCLHLQFTSIWTTNARSPEGKDCHHSCTDFVHGKNIPPNTPFHLYPCCSVLQGSSANANGKRGRSGDVEENSAELEGGDEDEEDEGEDDEGEDDEGEDDEDEEGESGDEDGDGKKGSAGPTKKVRTKQGWSLLCEAGPTKKVRFCVLVVTVVWA